MKTKGWWVPVALLLVEGLKRSRARRNPFARRRKRDRVIDAALARASRALSRRAPRW
ncbi:hypothetical protein [Deinococcus maricopensis]|uniref:hypothetical protein n=1 Tax=Deinococcus maricopensis TaxID=309887 RepID=UPI00145D1C43|nr:hypothetical protein [Deinococcus maricopensis]